jgi:hypothetical protein
MFRNVPIVFLFIMGGSAALARGTATPLYKPQSNHPGNARELRRQAAIMAIP